MDVAAIFSTFFLKALKEKIFCPALNTVSFFEKELNVKTTQLKANYSIDADFTFGKECSVLFK